MKTFNKYLLVVITLCSVSMRSKGMQSNPIKRKIDTTTKFTDEKNEKIIKIWKMKKSLAFLAAISKPEVNDYAYLCPKHSPKHTNPQKINNLFFQSSLRKKNQWNIRILATPPFCEIEPLQKKIIVE